MKRGSPARDWRDSVAKLEAEGCCRVCGIERGLQQAHTAGRRFDVTRPGRKTLWVNPDAIVPLCPHCHHDYDAHDLDLLPYLTLDEQLYVVKVMGGIEAARIRLAPRDYKRDIQAARVEAELVS